MLKNRITLHEWKILVHPRKVATSLECNFCHHDVIRIQHVATFLKVVLCDTNMYFLPKHCNYIKG